MANLRRNTARPTLLERWARLAHRRRGRVIAAWVVLLAGLIASAVAFGGEYATNFKLPGSETQEALDLLEARFPAQSGDEAVVVFEAPSGMADPAVKSQVESLFAEVRGLKDFVEILSPYEEKQGYISQDGTIARALVRFSTQNQELDAEVVATLVQMADNANSETLRVEIGGDIVEFQEHPDFGSEFFGLGAAIIILFIAFGSVIAVGLPIGAAVFGLGAAFAIITVATRFFSFPEFSPQFAAMIGIGVGIDYSLLVVTRFREGLHTGHSVEESIVMATTTSGRAVLFAGTVVAIAFLGLFAMGIPFVALMGTTGAIVVALAVAVALTLTPALLSLAGHRIDRWHVPLLHSTEGVDPKSGWYRFSEAIQRHPLPYFLATATFLVVLALPVLNMRLGFTDAGNNPTHYHSRRAYDLLTEGFGPGFNGPLLVVADMGTATPDQVRAVRDAFASGPSGGAANNIAQVTPLVFNQSGDTAAFTVLPGTSPQDAATVDLVHHLRDRVIPPATEGTGLRVYVSGRTAAYVDIGDQISQRLPLLFGGVIGISFLLLLTVFRSVLVAAKAAIMNLLSIGASYGVLVAIFQWGWLAGPLNIQEGPVETFIPMMLFAILFGLSMDYEVFLISRIREEYVRTKHNATAVSHGLAATARVITAAAAIMVAVFLSFVLGEDRIIKEFGIGLATAIFVDATIVRLVLVPATMELLGDANWWLPRWLDRALPHIQVEGAEPEVGLPAMPAGGE
ncbi:MAG: MMPL family transporter [Chloroflexi bacterium]|nr:MMPL family transporter [Chloroflexota bacterium]